MYDLSVKDHTAAWRPRTSLTASQVASYLTDALKMFGRRVPDFVLTPEFVAQLDAEGEFSDTVDGIEIAVWRSP